MFSSIKDYFNICTVFVILWGLYGFHWYEVTKGTPLDSYSNLFLGVNFLICLSCLYRMRRWHLPPIFKKIGLLLFLFTLYGLFDVLFGGTYKISGLEYNKASYFISIYRSFFPLFAFYYYAKIGKLNNKTIKGYFVLLLVFYIIYDVFFSRYMLSIGVYVDGFTNNLGYIFLTLIPFAYVFEKKTIIQYSIVIISILLLFLSMKRGAIFIGAIICAWFFYNEFKVASALKKFLVITLTIGVVAVSSYYVVRFLQENSFAQARLEQTLQGDSSGRDDIYSSLLNIYNNESNIFEMLFGHGANAPARLTGHDAHNDWLEILLCQGLLGLIVYISYWIGLFKYSRKVKRNPEVYFIVGSFVLTQFLRSLISMSYAAIPTAAVLILGYAMASEEASHIVHTNNTIV